MAVKAMASAVVKAREDEEERQEIRECFGFRVSGCGFRVWADGMAS